jgi:hypothetical protein
MKTYPDSTNVRFNTSGAIRLLKTPIIVIVCIFTALNAFGQVYVSLANTSTTRFTTNGSNIGQGTGFISGSLQWRVGLYIAPDGETNESLFTLVAVATNTLPGRFTYPGGSVSIDGNSGTPIAFQVRTWSLSSGATYEEALTNFNGYIGKSPIGRITPVFLPAQPPQVFGTGTFQGQLTNGIELLPNFGPALYVLRPDSRDQLQPGSVFRVRWVAVGIPTPEWNLYLRTNNLGLRPLAATPVHDGGGNWHADITVPSNVRSGCDYEIILFEESSGLADISETFCIGVPTLSIRFSQVEICWNSRSDRTYQLQYRSSATTNIWTNLNAPIAGNATTNCVTDSISVSEPQRLYRVEELP